MTVSYSQPSPPEQCGCFAMPSASGPRRGLTLLEMFVTVAIVTLLMGYAWKIYFSSRETMRHTVSQSQMQAEMRIFLDKLAREIAASYSFHEIKPTENKFSFYAFKYARTVLEELYYDGANKALKPDKQKLRILHIEYEKKENGDIVRSQTPGFLYFLQQPMLFEPSTIAGAVDAEDKTTVSTVLHDIQGFEFRAYNQEFQPNNKTQPVKITPLPNPDNAASATFLVLRVHGYKDEKAEQRRNEELDIVCKLYSRVKLAEAAYPRYFSSVDTNPRF